MLAGATLEAATGGAVRAAVHRMAPQGAPRCAVVMRVRGASHASLPGAPGGTVAGFETHFRATRGSVDAHLGAGFAVDLNTGDGSAAARSVARAARVLQACAASMAEVVLAVPELAASIANTLAAIDESGVALARAELVCHALRSAVAPIWARRCAELSVRNRLRLFTELSPTGNATQWKRICRFICEPKLNWSVSHDGSRVYFIKGPARINMSMVFNAYCQRKNLSRDQLDFLFNHRLVQARRFLCGWKMRASSRPWSNSW